MTALLIVAAFYLATVGVLVTVAFFKGINQETDKIRIERQLRMHQ